MKTADECLDALTFCRDTKRKEVMQTILLDAYRAGMERAAKICAGRHPLATSPLALSCIIADAAQTAQLP